MSYCSGVDCYELWKAAHDVNGSNILGQIDLEPLRTDRRIEFSFFSCGFRYREVSSSEPFTVIFYQLQKCSNSSSRHGNYAPMDGAFKLQPVATCESTLELDTRMLARVQQLIQSKELLLSAVNEEILCSRQPDFF